MSAADIDIDDRLEKITNTLHGRALFVEVRLLCTMLQLSHRMPRLLICLIQGGIDSFDTISTDNGSGCDKHGNYLLGKHWRSRKNRSVSHAQDDRYLVRSANGQSYCSNSAKFAPLMCITVDVFKCQRG